MNGSLCRYLLLSSRVAYAACLPLVGFCLRASNCDAWVSWKVLAYGWIAMLTIPHPPHLIWLANPILLLSWILIAASLVNKSYGLKVAAVSTSGLALIVATSFLLPVSIVDNEGGVPVSIMSRGAGYWLWFVSILIAFASATLLPFQARSTTTGR